MWMDKVSYRCTGIVYQIQKGNLASLPKPGVHVMTEFTQGMSGSGHSLCSFHMYITLCSVVHPLACSWYEVTGTSQQRYRRKPEARGKPAARSLRISITYSALVD